MACHIICFVSFRFVSFRFVSFRFDLFRFVSICFVSFRFVSFRFDLFRFVPFRFCFVSHFTGTPQSEWLKDEESNRVYWFETRGFQSSLSRLRLALKLTSHHINRRQVVNGFDSRVVRAVHLKARGRWFDSRRRHIFSIWIFRLPPVVHSSAKTIQMKSSMMFIQSNGCTEIHLILKEIWRRLKMRHVSFKEVFETPTFR